MSSGRWRRRSRGPSRSISGIQLPRAHGGARMLMLMGPIGILASARDRIGSMGPPGTQWGRMRFLARLLRPLRFSGLLQAARILHPPGCSIASSNAWVGVVVVVVLRALSAIH